MSDSVMDIKCFAKLTCAGILCSGVLSSAANADPFAWELAEVWNGVLDLPDETKISYQVGYISWGEHSEFAISLSKGEASDGQELLRTMGDSRPRLTTEGDVIVVTWAVMPWGAYEETKVQQCWRLVPLLDDYQETDCPTQD